MSSMRRRASSIQAIQSKDDYITLIKHADPKSLVLIDFYADWCGPCKMIAPKLEKMEKEYPNVIFAKLNVDDNEDVALFCNIAAMPTFFFMKGGEKVDEITGANETKIREFIVKYSSKL